MSKEQNQLPGLECHLAWAEFLLGVNVPVLEEAKDYYIINNNDTNLISASGNSLLFSPRLLYLGTRPARMPPRMGRILTRHKCTSA